MLQQTIKYLGVFLALLGTQDSFGQAGKMKFSFDYSPNFSSVTNTVRDEELLRRIKLSHHILLRAEFQTNTIFRPVIGLGYWNTGEVDKVDAIGQLGIDQTKYIYNYNFVIIPIGTRICFDKFYFLPEVGLGINVSNKTKIITDFSDGRTAEETVDSQLNSGAFNKTSIPISINLGKLIKLNDKVLTIGIKGYYSLNQVVKDVPRRNNYYGIGLSLGMIL